MFQSEMSTPAALNRLRVAELRERLEGAGLSTEGTKPVLVARLLAGLGGDTVAHTPDTPSSRCSLVLNILTVICNTSTGEPGG